MLAVPKDCQLSTSKAEQSEIRKSGHDSLALEDQHTESICDTVPSMREYSYWPASRTANTASKAGTCSDTSIIVSVSLPPAVRRARLMMK